MAWMGDAERNEIAPGYSDPPIEVIGAILHVAVSEARSIRPIFMNRNGIESHFYIRRDGSIEQYRSTGYEADANYKANSFVHGGRRKGYVSIETQGMGPGEWTDAQMASIKRVLSWLDETHESFRMAVAQSPYGGGVGYHSQFLGVWTPVAKSCPGYGRIAQFENDIAPWINGGGKGNELSWNEDIAKWNPVDDEKGDSMTTGQSLNQARGYAEAAYEFAKSADNKATKAARRAGRIEKALEAIAAGISDSVSEAVSDALSDEYDVTLSKRDEK